MACEVVLIWTLGEVQFQLPFIWETREYCLLDTVVETHVSNISSLHDFQTKEL